MKLTPEQLEELRKRGRRGGNWSGLAYICWEATGGDGLSALSLAIEMIRLYPELIGIDTTMTERNAAIRAMRDTGEFTLAEIAEHFGLSTATVQRITAPWSRDP